VIQGIAGAGIGLLVGLLARPVLDAFIAARTTRSALLDDFTEDAAEQVTSS